MMRMNFTNLLKKDEKQKLHQYNYSRTLESSSTDFLQDDYFKHMNKTDYTYSRSPSYRRKIESLFYQIPNMSRRHVKGDSIDTGDIYLSTDDEEDYVTRRVKTRTVYNDGILLRSGNNLKTARSVIEQEELRRRRPLQSGNVNQNVGGSRSSSRRSLQLSNTNYNTADMTSRGSVKLANTNQNTVDVMSSSIHSFAHTNINQNAVETRSTARRAIGKSRMSQGSDYVTSTNQISESKPSSSSLSSSRASSAAAVRKTLTREFRNLEMEKNIKERQNSNQKTVKVNLYGLDHVDSEYSGIDSDEEFSGTNSSARMSSYRNRQSRSPQPMTSADSSSSSSSVVTTVTTTVVTTIIDSITNVAQPIAEPVWNTVGWPLWTYILHPVLSLATSVLSSISYVIYHLIWTSFLSHLVNGCVSSSQWIYSSVCSLFMQLIMLDLGTLSRSSRSSQGCCCILPLILLLPLFLYTLLPALLPSDSSLKNIWIKESKPVDGISGIEGLNSLNLNEHVRRIVIQIQKGRSDVMTVADVERIVQEIIQERMSQIYLDMSAQTSQQESKYQVNQDKAINVAAKRDDRVELVNQDQGINVAAKRDDKVESVNQDQGINVAAKRDDKVESVNQDQGINVAAKRDDKVESTGKFDSAYLKEEVEKIVMDLQKSKNKDLSISDVEQLVGKMLQEKILSVEGSLIEQRQQQDMKMNAEMEKENARLQEIQSQLSVRISNLEKKLAEEVKKLDRQEKVSAEETVSTLKQLHDDLASLRSQMMGIELDQQLIGTQLQNCCRNDSFYAMMIQDKVNFILGQIMSGNTSGNTEQDAFGAWFNSNFMRKSEFDEYMALFGKEITEKILKEVPSVYGTEVLISEATGGGGISRQVIQGIVDEALLKFSADKIGLPDFALESAGGSIVSTKCSQTYHKKTAQLSIMGIPLWYVSNSPRTVIQPEVQPGSCWAFQGSRGYLVIELSTVIIPTAFTLEHISKSLSPDGKIDSAPKDFTVIGLKEEKDKEGSVLGNFTYRDDGPPLQFFKIQNSKVGAYKFVELKILSNQGNPLYTCLYRFRVHGTPYRPPSEDNSSSSTQDNIKTKTKDKK